MTLPDPREEAAEVRRRQRVRATATAIALVAVAVLFYLITLAKMLG